MPRAPADTPYHAQLATLVDAPPEGDGWVHERKYDGYRIGCALAGGEVRLWSRRGQDWTDRLPEVVAAVRGLPCRSALLDGEVAALLPDGRTSFQALQNAFAGGPRALAYFVFDLLQLDGEDLAPRPLLERKAALERLLAGCEGALRYAPHHGGRGAELLRQACRRGEEGIVSKRADAPYRPGRGPSWTKAKCLLRQELVIGGFTEPEGQREGIGALLVGVREPGAGGGLRFAGKVGTGFTNAGAQALRTRLAPLVRAASPFTPPPRGGQARAARWVEPLLVAEVAFSEWTADGKVRHPSFQGLREDKAPAEVVREAPRRLRAVRPDGDGARGGEEGPVVAGVRISHPNRVLWEGLGLTKLDLARYYDAVAPVMVPHLAGRPLTLLSCPAGIAAGCHFMKHAKAWGPAALRRVAIQEKTKVGEYLVADTPAALVSAAQMGIVELHTWNATVDALETPDRIVLDLDPGPLVPWRAVLDAARLAREALHALGFGAFVKTTGGAGLHVVAPLVPAARWELCLALARGLASALARHDPRRLTTTFARAGRESKILIDYLRNNRTNTSVAAFSARARAGAPVSTPVAWDELGPRLDPARLTVRSVPRRLATLGADPWAGYRAAARALDPDRLTARLAARLVPGPPTEPPG